GPRGRRPPCQLRGSRAARHGAVAPREIEGERAPLAGLAVDPELPAQEIGDLAADGEAEPGTTVLAVRPTVRLLKRLEDDVVLLARDADPGVAHVEGDDVVGVRQGR